MNLRAKLPTVQEGQRRQGTVRLVSTILPSPLCSPAFFLPPYPLFPSSRHFYILCGYRSDARETHPSNLFSDPSVYYCSLPPLPHHHRPERKTRSIPFHLSVPSCLFFCVPIFVSILFLPQRQVAHQAGAALPCPCRSQNRNAKHIINTIILHIAGFRSESTALRSVLLGLLYGSGAPLSPHFSHSWEDHIYLVGILSPSPAPVCCLLDLEADLTSSKQKYSE